MPEHLELLPEDDEAFLPGLRKGDQQAYKGLFERYYPVLTVFAARYVDSLEVAKEVAQEVFVKLYQKRETIHIRQSLKAYLFRAVYHTCINTLEAQQRRQDHHHSAFRQQPQSDFSDNLEETEAVQRIYKAIEKLPDQCRRIFTMNRFEDMTNQEIADELGLSKRTVETQISKALKLLRQTLLILLTGVLLLVL